MANLGKVRVPYCPPANSTKFYNTKSYAWTESLPVFPQLAAPPNAMRRPFFVGPSWDLGQTALVVEKDEKAEFAQKAHLATFFSNTAPPPSAWIHRKPRSSKARTTAVSASSLTEASFPHGLDRHAGPFIPPPARREHLGHGASQLRKALQHGVDPLVEIIQAEAEFPCAAVPIQSAHLADAVVAPDFHGQPGLAGIDLLGASWNWLTSYSGAMRTGSGDQPVKNESSMRCLGAAADAKMRGADQAMPHGVRSAAG